MIMNWDALHKRFTSPWLNLTNTTVECHYAMVEYNIRLYGELQPLMWNMNQTFNLHKTPRMLEKIDCVITASHFIMPWTHFQCSCSELAQVRLLMSKHETYSEQAQLHNFLSTVLQVCSWFQSSLTNNGLSPVEIGLKTNGQCLFFYFAKEQL